MRAALLALLLATGAHAQDGEFGPDFDAEDGGFATTEGLPPQGDVEASEVERVSQGGAAVLRGLDKMSGEVRDMPVGVGQSQRLGRLEITLTECRYPTDNPAGNAYAHLRIREAGQSVPRFQGWMVAASPALNALDHPRYDVWVMRCTSS